MSEYIEPIIIAGMLGQLNPNEKKCLDGIRSRCNNPNSTSYPNYGAKGIKVCARWSGHGGLKNFLIDMGAKPSYKHSIDRIDSNGNYEPSNCRWATKTEQARNTSSARLLTYKGETLPIKDWAEKLNIKYETLNSRVYKYGWSVEKAFETPAMINNLEKSPSTIGQRIKAAREKAGLSQTQLAELLGYNTPTAISLIESDERSVKVETLKKIADVLHQDVTYIATGKKSEPTVKTALRADDNFDASDVKQIESFIDYLMAQKEKKEGV
mgnify:CR=1 FL=1